MPEQVIEYKTKCEICEAHETDLGVLKDIWETINKEFPELNEEGKLKLTEMWFVQHKLDERTNTIQGFKTRNIKAINK